MLYINIIPAVLTSLLIPFLFKLLDVHINRSSRLNERLKATQLYYELKSKQTNFIELQRAAQAMVSNQNATVSLVDTFVELCHLDNDCRQLNQDIDIIVSAEKYLIFDALRELKDRIVFIEELSSKSKRSIFKLKKNTYYVICVVIGCIPFAYLERTIDAIVNKHSWVDFYFGYQANSLLLCFYSLFLLITSFIFAIRHINDVFNLNDAEKLLKRIQEKLTSSDLEKQVSKPEETQVIAS